MILLGKFSETIGVGDSLKDNFDKSKKCVEISDNYAIDFAVWLNTNYFQIVGKKVWTKNLDYDVCYAAKELLEIFKKEKGL
jgi:hypothetical protein